MQKISNIVTTKTRRYLLEVTQLNEINKMKSLQEREVLALERIANFLDKLHVTPKGRIGVTHIPKFMGHERGLLESIALSLQEIATSQLEGKQLLTEESEEE